MLDLYVVAVIVLIVLEIFTIGFVVGFWFAAFDLPKKEIDENARKTENVQLQSQAAPGERHSARISQKTTQRQNHDD